MNGFSEPGTSDASEGLAYHDRVLTWDASLAMLPLVGRIAADVRRLHGDLARLLPERDRLERERRTLAWPERARRYELEEVVAAVEKDYADAKAELEVVGVALLDAARGLVGFPTVVNDRPAFFSWQPDEEGLNFWNFAGDTVRRPVPVDWTKPARDRKGRRKSGPAAK
jgi:hypothetical protein